MSRHPIGSVVSVIQQGDEAEGRNSVVHLAEGHDRNEWVRSSHAAKEETNLVLFLK